eukprot:Skav234296  [mRNA]  locus=scaffold2271:238880:240301:+ [translate_table: standard]
MAQPQLSDLSAYFLSNGYKTGQVSVNNGPNPNHAYRLDADGKTFVHQTTGIKVWSFALDMLPAGRRPDWIVLYHYTTQYAFDLITDISRQDTVQLFASKEALKDCHFGPGLYATCKAPDQWQTQEEVLCNNYYPTQANWQRRHPNAALPQWMHQTLRAYATQHHDGKAACCIPVLCDRQQVIDAMTQPTLEPAIQGGRLAGHDVHGTPQPAQRDVWVISKWDFPPNKPAHVINLMNTRDELTKIILQRLQLKLVGAGVALTPEIQNLLNPEFVPGRWRELTRLCNDSEIRIPSPLMMMADAEAAKGLPPDVYLSRNVAFLQHHKKEFLYTGYPKEGGKTLVLTWGGDETPKDDRDMHFRMVDFGDFVGFQSKGEWMYVSDTIKGDGDRHKVLIKSDGNPLTNEAMRFKVVDFQNYCGIKCLKIDKWLYASEAKYNSERRFVMCQMNETEGPEQNPKMRWEKQELDQVTVKVSP